MNTHTRETTPRGHNKSQEHTTAQTGTHSGTRTYRHNGTHRRSHRHTKGRLPRGGDQYKDDAKDDGGGCGEISGVQHQQDDDHQQHVKLEEGHERKEHLEQLCDVDTHAHTHKRLEGQTSL